MKQVWFVVRLLAGVIGLGHLLGFVWFFNDLSFAFIVPAIVLTGCALVTPSWLREHLTVVLAVFFIALVVVGSELSVAIPQNVDPAKTVILLLEGMLLLCFSARVVLQKVYP